MIWKALLFDDIGINITNLACVFNHTAVAQWYAAKSVVSKLDFSGFSQCDIYSD